MDTDEKKIKALQQRIRALLEEKQGILLAHNYQRPEVQDVADLCGDSLDLSNRASQTDARIIVFCGVHFMAETASILSPEKTILLPVIKAGCPMADMITGAELIEKRSKMPEAVVVSYVNTTAEVKAESDICCTSANAVQVVNSIEPERPVFMTPDKNLAQYTKKQTGRDISYWNGFCPVHNNLSPARVRAVKARHPEALFFAHPECPPGVLDLADKALSTSGMITEAGKAKEKEIIIGTETGILYPLSKAFPDKVFIPVDENMVCRDMKKTGLADIITALEEEKNLVKVPEDIAVRAKSAVERMLAVPRG